MFWPFVYQRHEKKFIATLVASSWAIAILISIVLWVCNTYGFSVVVPGCIPTGANDLSPLGTAAVYLVLIIIPVICIVLPLTLYTIMYCKARQIRKQIRIVPVNPDTEDARKAEQETQRRANRAKLTYVSMVVVLFATNALSVTELVTLICLYHLGASISTTATVGYWFKIIICGYTIGDIIILSSNKEHRDAVKKLLKKWKWIK